MNLRRAFGSLVPWVLLGAIGWVGLGWLMATMLAADPPKAGFDLNLLLDAARRVSQGASPYVQSQLFDGSGSATDLFYSYPPPVAQALVLVAGLTNAQALVLWAIGATAGLGIVAALLGAGGGLDPRRTAVRAIAVAPFVLPFAVALLFGNLDAWYPLGYGLVLLGVLPGAGRWRLLAGGAALALMALAKLHPAGLIAWVAVRALVGHGGPNARILGVTTVVGCVVVALSVAAGGLQPWRDWLDVARAAANLELVDARNLGPVSLLGLASGTEGDTLRLVQAAIALLAVGLTALAAWRIRDPVASLAIAAALSLVILPVTWYHYAVALTPFAIVLAIHHPASRPQVAAALVIADLAIGWLPLTWLAVVLLLIAAWRSAPATTTYRRVFA